MELLSLLLALGDDLQLHAAATLSAAPHRVLEQESDIRTETTSD